MPRIFQVQQWNDFEYAGRIQNPRLRIKQGHAETAFGVQQQHDANRLVQYLPRRFVNVRFGTL